MRFQRLCAGLQHFIRGKERQATSVRGHEELEEESREFQDVVLFLRHFRQIIWHRDATLRWIIKGTFCDIFTNTPRRLNDIQPQPCLHMAKVIARPQGGRGKDDRFFVVIQQTIELD